MFKKMVYAFVALYFLLPLQAGAQVVVPDENAATVSGGYEGVIVPPSSGTPIYEGVVVGGTAKSSNSAAGQPIDFSAVAEEQPATGGAETKDDSAVRQKRMEEAYARQRAHQKEMEAHRAQQREEAARKTAEMKAQIESSN